MKAEINNLFACHLYQQNKGNDTNNTYTKQSHTNSISNGDSITIIFT